MKGKMSIPVRAALGKLLEPLAGESTRLLMYREFRESLSMSEEEQKLIGLQTIVNRVTNEIETYIQFPEKDPMKEVEVGEIITEVVCGILKPMEDAKNMDPKYLDLFLWFKPEIDKMREREAEQNQR